VKTLPDIPEIKNQIKVISIIHFSLMSGVLIFFIAAIIIVRSKTIFVSKDLDNIFSILVPVYGLLMMFLSRMIFNIMISRLAAVNSLLEKIAKYRSAKIVSWTLTESACLFALVATLLTSNYLYIVIFIFLFGYFFMLRPSKKFMINDLQLNQNEMNLI
jgi:hypothetical protein